MLNQKRKSADPVFESKRHPFIIINDLLFWKNIEADWRCKYFSQIVLHSVKISTHFSRETRLRISKTIQ